MAQTLTEARKVAWRIQGIGPDPAHYLVVFKKIREGRLLHKLLRPGEVLKLSLLDSTESYEAYAVSADGNLRHGFSRKYQAVGQTWTFTLDFNLDFRVTDAQRLALNLSGGDPLERLQEEVAKVLSGTARRLPWEVMKREGEEFGLLLRDTETTDGQGERRTNFQRLQSFAIDLGFELQQLEITRSLTEIDVKPEVTVREVERQIEIERSQQSLELERERLTHEQTLWRERLKQEREIFVAKGNQALQGMERLRIVLDGIAREGVRGLSQAVDGVRSFPAIRDALIEIQGIQASLGLLSGGQASTPTLNVAASNPLLQAVPSGHLLETSPRPSDPLERLVTEAFQHLHVLNGNPEDKRRILTAVLHLVAEAGMGRAADEEFLAAFRDDLRERIDPVKGALEEDQLDFLTSILNLEELRQKLSG